jgi:bifunctional non-homologous end joining protein LigD
MGLSDPRDVERARARIPVTAVFFDCLSVDQHDLRKLPLITRKECLRLFLPARGIAAYGDHVSEHGAAFYEAACDRGLEGVIAKRADSVYAGERARHWLKIKCQLRQEFVIGGYTRPQGTRAYFGALHLGVYENDRLVYAGKVGTGFDTRKLGEIHDALERLRRPTSPFDTGSPSGRDHFWVEPRLVAEVRFSEWTREGRIRQSAFLGLRTDRAPDTIKREHSEAPSAPAASSPDGQRSRKGADAPSPRTGQGPVSERRREVRRPAARGAQPPAASGDSSSRYRQGQRGDARGVRPSPPVATAEGQPRGSQHGRASATALAGDKSQTMAIGRSRSGGPSPRGKVAAPAPSSPPAPRVTVSNLTKVFWPREGYTKGNLIAYYEQIAPLLLPYLRHRPLVLTRYPEGIEGKSFFQKDALPFVPEWIRTERIYSEETSREISYLIVDSVESLRYVINMGTIPLHLWASRVGSLDQPDWLVLDLDPKGAPFVHVVRIARLIHDLLVDLSLPSYVKTSGATGLHVLLPLGARYTYEETRGFARLLATLAVEEAKEIATVVRSLRSREGKVYVDWGQNGRGQTIVAPFSVRPRDGAPVSCPLTWDDVTERLDPGRFTIETVPPRFTSRPDPLKPVLGRAIDMTAALAAAARRLAGRGGDVPTRPSRGR